MAASSGFFGIAIALIPPHNAFTACILQFKIERLVALRFDHRDRLSWITSSSSQGPWLRSIDHSSVIARSETYCLHPFSPDQGWRLATLPQLHAALVAFTAFRRPSPTCRSPVPGQDCRLASNNGDRAAGQSNAGSGCFSECPDGLLGRPLPAHWYHRARTSARLAHRAVGRRVQRASPDPSFSTKFAS